MKIAFAGKDGSGKTTLSSLFTRHLAARGLPVVAIDADINQHLAEALGADREPPAMGGHLTEIKEYLRGSNPRISSAAALGLLRDALDAQPRDWARYTRQGAEFHVRNACAWASAAAGEDLTAQVDPGFTLGPRRQPA